jgi:hypothetical protein
VAPPWIIVLGALSIVLFIVAVVFWVKVGARDTTIVQIQNRADQIQAAAVVLQAQLDEV